MRESPNSTPPDAGPTQSPFMAPPLKALLYGIGTFLWLTAAGMALLVFGVGVFWIYDGLHRGMNTTV